MPVLLSTSRARRTHRPCAGYGGGNRRRRLSSYHLVSRARLLIFAAVACTVAVAASAGAAGVRAAALPRAGVFTGYAFDTCSAPSLSTLQAWLASPYRAVGI